jgi:hypothetical protein
VRSLISILCERRSPRTTESKSLIGATCHSSELKLSCVTATALSAAESFCEHDGVVERPGAFLIPTSSKRRASPDMDFKDVPPHSE